LFPPTVLFRTRSPSTKDARPSRFHAATSFDFRQQPVHFIPLFHPREFSLGGTGGKFRVRVADSLGVVMPCLGVCAWKLSF
jgi:hypothetical protein